MKQIMKIFVLAVLIFFTLAGCGDTGNSGKGVGGVTTVDQVISDQINAADNAPAEAASATQNGGLPVNMDALSATPVDYDLTTMNSDMVYATVYQFMVEPDSYVGKSVRMKGLYYVGYYEPTAQYYHYCLIQDALSCCAQGLEFVWDDGSHVYPDEYPTEETEIVVQGVFDLYQEEGDDLLYCRLKDAVMVVDGGA